MASNTNVVVLAGRLGQPPKVRSSNVVELSLAVNRAQRNGDAWQDKTHWINVTCFGKLTDRVIDIAKGTLVIVTGHLQINEYDAKDGTHRSVLQVIADRVETISQAKPKQQDVPTMYDTDVPF